MPPHPSRIHQKVVVINDQPMVIMVDEAGRAVEMGSGEGGTSSSGVTLDQMYNAIVSQQNDIQEVRDGYTALATDFDGRIDVLEAAPPGGGGGATTEDWHIVGATDQPAFADGWSNLPDPAGWPSQAPISFRKDTDKVVRLRGRAVTNQSSSFIFLLPDDYRPTNIEEFRCMAAPKNTPDDVYLSEEWAYVKIIPNGCVVVSFFTSQSETNLFVILDGLTFGLD